jgi:hypothetical protein
VCADLKRAYFGTRAHVPQAEHNVFDLDLGASPPTPLQEHQRITIRFDTRRIRQKGSPAHSLAEAIQEEGWFYPDFADDLITVFGTVELGGQSLAQPSNHLPIAEQFGSTGDTGRSLDYARGDHVHAMPPDPIPPHVANPDAHKNHNIKGDVERTLSTTFIQRLQGVTLNASGPFSPADNGKVLTFRDGEWHPENPATSPRTGQFVEHPTPKRYLIVAAGHFQNVQTPSGNVGVPIGPVYNKLRAEPRGIPTPNATGYLLHFGGGTTGNPSNQYINPIPDRKFVYIVKGTTISKNMFGHFSVIEFNDEGIIVQVVRGSNPEVQVDSFMVEISLYGEF